MPSLSKDFNVTQTRVFVKEDLTIEKSDHFPKHWLIRSGNEKNISVLDIVPEYRFPILKMISTLEISSTSQVGDVFRIKISDNKEQQFHITVSRSGRSSANYLIELDINDFDRSSSVNSLKIESLNKDRLNSIKDKINNCTIPNELKQSILLELKSIQNQFIFRERILNKQNNDLRLLLENNAQACLLIDHLYSIIDLNGKAYDLLKEIFHVDVQKNQVITELLTSDDKKEFQQNFQRITSGKNDHRASYFEYYLDNGEKQTIKVDYYAVDRGFSENKAVTVLISDVTQLQLRQSMNRLNLDIMELAMKPGVLLKEVAELFISRYQEIFENTKCCLLEVKGDSIKSLIHPDMPAEFIQKLNELNVNSGQLPLNKSIKDKIIYVIEDCQNFSDDDEFQSYATSSTFRSNISYPIVNRKDECVAVFCIFREIVHSPPALELDYTQQFAELFSIIMEMEKSRRDNERLLASIQDGFFSLDSSMVINYWNKSAEKITGIKVKNVLNRYIWDVFPKIELDTKNEFIELIESNDHGSLTSYFPLLEKWFELIVYPKEEGLTSVFFRDVSERKNNEQKIIDTNIRLEKVMDAANDAIYELDLDKNIISWSNGYKDLFGHEPKNNQTSGQEWFDLVHPEQRESLVKKFRRIVFNSDAKKWSSDYSYQRAEGSYAHVLDKGHIIRDKNGKATALIGAVTDISHHKEYESSLEYLNSILRKRAVELNENNAELEQFAYLASHDLQEPLRTITNFLSQIEKKYSNKLDKQGLKYIAFAVDGATRMRNLITDVLEYSKLGNNKEHFENVNLNAVVNSVKVSLKQSIKANKASIKHDDLPIVRGSETRIYHIFSNLIGNAIKYRKEDVAPEILIEYKELKNAHRIKFIDNGIGISPEFHDKIFEIFKRLHHDQKYSGTGIGLALVKKSLDLMDGSINVSSHEDGSIFTITLPKHNRNQQEIK